MYVSFVYNIVIESIAAPMYYMMNTRFIILC